MQRVIGVALGAVITFVLLVLFTPKEGDPTTWYLTAVAIGAIVSLLWPWVIGLILARRVKSRREEKIEAEVQRQLAEERSKPSG